MLGHPRYNLSSTPPVDDAMNLSTGHGFSTVNPSSNFFSFFPSILIISSPSVVIQMAPLAPRFQIRVIAVFRRVIEMGHGEHNFAARYRVRFAVYRPAMRVVWASLALPSCPA